MEMTHEYRAMREDEKPRVAWLLSQAFGSPIEGANEWVGKQDARELRVMATAGREPDASLMFIPMGLFVGGKSVPQLGVAAVSTAPEVRGSGIAKRLMQESVRETARRGVPLGVLYPATHTLYRRAGYEQAASHFCVTIELSRVRMEKSDRAATVRRLTLDDRETLERVHRERTRWSTGEIDRGAYVWGRIYEPRSGAAEGWCVEEAGQITGWVFASRTVSDPTLADPYAPRWLTISDAQAFTAVAARRLLALIADENSMWKHAKLFCGPTHPMLSHLPEPAYKMTLADTAMVRIIDVIGALQARGWGEGVTGTVALDIEDDLIEANNGWFTLRVEGGDATVTHERSHPSGVPALSMSIRDLAMIYTGYATPRGASTMGTLRGDDRALDIAGTLFAGPYPGMTDQF